MSIIRGASNDSDTLHTIFSFLSMAAAVIFCCSLSHATVAAQNRNMEARVMSMKPGAQFFYRNAQGQLTPFTLGPGNLLQSGNVIDTGRTGRVVIAFLDGSQVIIYERSRVELKDFRPGSSWLDQLSVIVGRVRATINHKVKRPEPYRVYSPIASIAVRGTDFSVIVEQNTETRVVVYEGLVEVSSLINPQQTVFARRGRNVVVRPWGDIGLISSGPGSQLNGASNVRGLGFTYDVKLYSNDFVSYRLNDQVTFFPLRFTAFSDSHFDSLQNPAFASDFKGPEARFYFISSLSRPSLTRQTGATGVEIEPADFLNHTASGQSSFFTPVGNSRNVIGGSFALAQTRLRAATDWGTQYVFSGSPVVRSQYHEHQDVDSKLMTSDVSFVAARRLGSGERSSVGIKLDYLTQRTSYASQSQGNFDQALNNYLRTRTESSGRELDRARLTVGVARQIGEDKKIGIFYRYGRLSESITPKEYSDTCQVLECTRDRFPSVKNSLDQISSEVGLLFRGSINSKLYYGLDGGIFLRRRSHNGTEDILTFVKEQLEPEISQGLEDLKGPSQLDIAGKSIRGGGGIGYALGEDTVFSVDISGGTERYDLKFNAGGTGFDLPKFQAINFVTAHAGGQTEIRKRLLVSGSYLYTSGCCLSANPFIFISRFQLNKELPSQYLNLGAGWRIKRNWIAQYIYSSDFGSSLPSHTLMFRYDLGGKGEK